MRATSTESTAKGRLGLRAKLALLAMAGTLGFAMAPATAANNPTEVLTLPGATIAGYFPSTVVVLKGRNLYYRNLDIAPHNVVSNNGRFSSGALIGTNRRAKVVGVNLLKKGKYGFYCTLHPQMKGTLRVV